MEQIYHIKYLRNQKGKSLRKICRETGHDFETVKKYVAKDNFNLDLRPKRRKGKLEPYKELIDSWLIKDLEAKPKQRHTAQRVYDRLKEIYQAELNISDRAIRAYVSRRKKELGLDTECYLPLEHPPGEAQVDFGEAQFIEKGIKYDGYYLNLSFPYSNAGFFQLFKGQNQECLLQGLKDICEYIGNCPTAIWFDNMSTVVNALRKQGERDLTKGFQRFMLHYGFLSNFCNPNSGHEKGHVENKVGYHRRNFLVPIPEAVFLSPRIRGKTAMAEAWGP
jgi:transposase